MEAAGAVGAVAEGGAEDRAFVVINLSFSMQVPLTGSGLLLLLVVG